MRKNLPAVGQSYKHRDLPLAAQVTKNWFPEINQETSVIVSLQPFPGTVLFSAGVGADRGMTVWNDVIYKVTDTTLYSINNAGVQVAIGDILGDKRCTFPASLEFMVIVTSGLAYLYDGMALSIIDDVDLEPPNYGAYLNSQWIYQGTGARWAVSDAGQPTEVSGLNYATAESDGDLLVRPYVFRQVLYLFGTATIESWYNSGVGSPPFDRIEGGIIQKGTISPDSISNNDDFIYFLGDDWLVYQMAGAQVRTVGTIPLAREFEEYANITNAVGFCYAMFGQEFYQLNVAAKTWVFNQSSGSWFELTMGYDEKQATFTDYVNHYSRHLVASGGNLYEYTPEAYDWDGLPMVRERITGLISGETFAEEWIGRRIFMSQAEIIIKGIPPLGDAPQIMLSWSDDAGFTWSNERLITCGKLGNYNFKAVAHMLGEFHDRVFKIRMTDTSAYSIHRMSGDINAG